ncbi:PREDICTED: uncharacterized protein LOC104779165 [Camelina sativa]|uniref:Uncharacterized protein LOC104779165 n=1 Tax=Camelina sativa TaxID=90675 RepID=A0ABM0YJC1_CAMSA|nr:PREDICTED: uncharacterized protein LOC104779165 [Camelina sativa]
MHVELDKDDEQDQGCVQKRVGEACEAGKVGEVGKVAETGQVKRVKKNELTRNDENVASDEREDMLQMCNGDRLQGTKVNVEWEDGLNLTVGQEFGSKKVVQDLLEKQAHKSCYKFVIVKSEPKLYVVKCSETKKGCKWSLRVAKLKNSECFSVRTYNKLHLCFRSTTSTNRIKRKGTPRLIVSVLRDDYPCKLKTPVPKEVIPLVQSRVGVKVSYSTAWRGKKEDENDVRGSDEENYKILHSYLHMLEIVNPRTISFVELDEKKRFQYLFFALGACIEGFAAMRKVIIVDGTHLKTSQGGVLIIASAQDPDHHHYHIAFGVVDGEKEASWSWFFYKLKSIIPDGPELVFVSDRCPSLIKERYHAKANYLDKYVEAKNWARCYFPAERYNIDTSNYVESINGVFKEARQLSLLPMIDAIVDKFAEWYNKHRNEAEDAPITQMMVPFVEKVLHSRCANAKLLPMNELNSFFLVYNVIGVDSVGYLVDLKNKTCSCKQFDIDQYLCEHAIAAAMEATNNIENEIQLQDLCSKYYWMEQWSLAYCRTIYPLSHMSQWVCT